MSIQHDRGRRAEQAAAKRLGARRVGNTGRRTPDLEGPGWIAEVKARARLPRWFTDPVAQVEAAAQEYPSPVRALVIFHELGARRNYVLMTEEQYQEWHGALADPQVGQV